PAPLGRVRQGLLPEPERQRDEGLAVAPAEHDDVEGQHLLVFRWAEQVLDALDEAPGLADDHVVDDEVAPPAVNQTEGQDLQEASQCRSRQQPVQGIVAGLAAPADGGTGGMATEPEQTGNEGGNHVIPDRHGPGIGPEDPRQDGQIERPVSELLYAGGDGVLHGFNPVGGSDTAAKRRLRYAVFSSRQVRSSRALALCGALSAFAGAVRKSCHEWRASCHRTRLRRAWAV